MPRKVQTADSTCLYKEGMEIWLPSWQLDKKSLMLVKISLACDANNKFSEKLILQKALRLQS